MDPLEREFGNDANCIQRILPGDPLYDGPPVWDSSKKLVPRYEEPRSFASKSLLLSLGLSLATSALLGGAFYYLTNESRAGKQEISYVSFESYLP